MTTWASDSVSKRPDQAAAKRTTRPDCNPCPQAGDFFAEFGEVIGYLEDWRAGREKVESARARDADLLTRLGFLQKPRNLFP